MSYRGEAQERFDVRSVDLIKITKPVDLEIVIAEADFCLTGIERQIREGFDGPEWQRSALRAKDEIEHKKRLATLKRDVMLTNKASVPNPDDVFKKLFMRAAATGLDEVTYARIFDAAKLLQGALA